MTSATMLRSSKQIKADFPIYKAAINSEAVMGFKILRTGSLLYRSC